MSNNTHPTKILIIDDEAIIRQSFADHLEDLGYLVLTAENGRFGLELLEREQPDLVLTDLRMPEVDGLEVIRRSGQLAPDIPVIVVSGVGRIRDAIQAVRLGAWDYIPKPVEDLSVLEHQVRKALEKARLMRENRMYQASLERLVRERTAELEQSNVRLGASEERYRTLFERSGDAIFLVDVKTGMYINANQAAEQLTGYTLSEIKTKTVRDLSPKGAETKLGWATTLEAAENFGEVIYVRADGAERVAILTAFPLQKGELVVGMAHDITQRKQREAEHVRQERLAAVGQLAAGIAHDFNNVMAVITLYSDLLQRSSNLSKNDLEKLLVIYQQAQHAAELTRQILDFSRRSVREPRPLDVKALLNEMLKFVERTIPESIQVQLTCSRGYYMINADPTQIQQVITNLTVNARDAMPHGGSLYFSLSSLSLHVGETYPCADMSPGEWVRLTVTDTGAGIGPDALPHIFEPFFTTKEVGKGTGLGLAQVYGIVQQHEGCITVESGVGAGAQFTIYLPALARETAVSSEPLADILPGQGETILLVEDDQVLLEAIHALLESLNYQVLTAVDGQEALTLYRAQPNQVDLILADVVMPKMDGMELVQSLQDNSPPPKVLLMSGFPRDREMRPEIKQFIAGWLQKPLDLQQLAQTLQELLHP